ncbi:aldehyde dehydrogenase family protein [bacterium]|nr:aldehyde dehydrogenase family protein [bacterium]
MSAQELKVINPYTEEVAFTLPMLSRGDLDPVVARARQAFRAWRKTPVAERVALCGRFAEAFESMRSTIAADITAQMGKPLRQANNEINGLLERTRGMMALAEATLADEWLPEKPGFARYIRHEPVGVVLDIAAWNYPLLIAVNVVVPPSLQGNAVILKHSSKTPRCVEALRPRLPARRRHPRPGSVGGDGPRDHRGADPASGIDRVSFTEISRRRAADQPRRRRPLHRRGTGLGGKDPAYVCADADFDYAVENTVDGVFYNAGQSCCAVERIYVERSIYEKFVEAFAAKTREYNVLGDPRGRRPRWGRWRPSAPGFWPARSEEAVRKGGRLVVRPDEFSLPPTGWFCPPAVVADAPQDCSLMQEGFSPVRGHSGRGQRRGGHPLDE